MSNPELLRLSFEPAAIRAHFEDDPEMAAVLERITDQQLHDAAANFLAASDVVYERFHEWCQHIVDAAKPWPCDCEQPGFFCSGVPGILAHMEDGRLAPGARVERCDSCDCFASDESAYAKLLEMGLVDVPYELRLALKEFVDTIDSTGGVRKDEGGCVVPVADHDWIDLGDAYLHACRALGQQPLWQ